MEGERKWKEVKRDRERGRHKERGVKEGREREMEKIIRRKER